MNIASTSPRPQSIGSEMQPFNKGFILAVTWVYLSEIFPNRARGLAMAAATLSLWLADFLVTYTFPLLIKNFSTSTTLLFYAGTCAVALVFVYVRLPETAGKSLEEIENVFKK